MKIKSKSMLMILPMIASLLTPVTSVYAADNNDDYLHTDGSKIYDDYGNEVRLTGIAWFGNETPNYSYHGLWSNTMDGILSKAADNGFNLLRVPLSVELINKVRLGENPMPDSMNDYLNPDLAGLSSIELIDKSIAICKQKGMKVMLDMHRVYSGDQSPTWHTSEFSVEDYEECCKFLAERYKDDDTVIAFDLFNEPHGKAYRKEINARWDDSQDDQNNWKYEAEKVGKAVLDINPKLLLMIEGVETYPKEGYSYDTASGEDQFYGGWWGGNLRGVKDHPVQIEGHPNQVVYSPHDYGPGVSSQTWFDKDFTMQTLLDDVWRDSWFYIQEQNIAPLLIGEWGGNLDGGKNQAWLQYMADLIEKNNLSHTFWCLNPNSGDTGGILGYDFSTVDEAKMNLVRPTLWQTDSGKFIGLDHKVDLGKNGTHVQAGIISTPDPVEPVEVLKGDVNGDEKINIKDYIRLQKYVVNSDTEINENNSDMNGDEKINITDALLLKKKILD